MSSQTGPPGFDDTSVDTTKPKTKSVKRNERKKEKRIQVSPLLSHCLKFIIALLIEFRSVIIILCCKVDFS